MQAEDLARLPGSSERPVAAHSSGPWFARFAGLVLAYLLFVIVFGAWVRITGSGAGCGDHWPTCHGELVPRSPSVQTLIEYTHRIFEASAHRANQVIVRHKTIFKQQF